MPLPLCCCCCCRTHPLKARTTHPPFTHTHSFHSLLIHPSFRPPPFPRTYTEQTSRGGAKQQPEEEEKEIDAPTLPTTTTLQPRTTTTINERPLPPSQHLSTRPWGGSTPSRARGAGAWAILAPPPLSSRRPHHLPSVHARGPPPREWELCE